MKFSAAGMVGELGQGEALLQQHAGGVVKMQCGSVSRPMLRPPEQAVHHPGALRHVGRWGRLKLIAIIN